MDRRKLLALGAGAAVTAATAAATGGAAQAAPSATSDAAVPSASALARSLSRTFTSNTVQVNGIRLHYVAGGTGEPLILLHGWPQTWWEYRKVMPALARNYRVIAVDLRGAGGSSKPQSGYDKKNMARDIYELVQALGYDKVHIAGHDVGAMVTYSYAVHYPNAIDKLVMLDVTHPDPGYYEFRMLPAPGVPFHPWWFAFNQLQSLPEQLVTGRSRFLVDWMFDYLLTDPNAISNVDRAIFAAAYATPDAIRGGNGWYQSLHQDIADSTTYPQVHTPILGLVNDLFSGGFTASLQATTTNSQVVVLPGVGHYFVDEAPTQVVQHIEAFLG